MNAGKLVLSEIGNAGGPSALGNTSNAAANLILGVNPVNAAQFGTLSYVGSGVSSTDRLFTIASAKGIIENMSETGTLVFSNTGAIAYDHAGAVELELKGSNNTRNVFNPLITNNGSSVVSVRKGGVGSNANTGGHWVLANEANSYTGSTYINSGILEVAKLANGGVVSSIGASSNAAANLKFFRAGLSYTGSGDSTNRLFSISGYSSPTAGNRIDSSGTGALKFVNTGAIMLTSNANGSTAAIGGGGHLVLGGTNTDDNTMAVLIGGTSATSSRLTKDGAGKWILTNANSSYVGITEVLGGTLGVHKLSNANVNSSIGKASAANTAGLLVVNGGTLQYLGSGDSTDRRFTIGQNGGGFDSSGTGAVKWSNTSDVVYTVANAARTITLSGSNSGDNTFAASIGNAGSGAVSLLKSGEGKWIVSGANSYTGSTLITGGELVAASNAALGTSAVTVNGGRLAIQEGINISNNIRVVEGSVSRAVAAGSAYSLGATGVVFSDITGGITTTVSIVDSQLASGTLSLTYGFTNSSTALNDALRRSDVFQLSGTGNDIFVLELSLDALESGDLLSWFNTDSQQWVSATDGNSASGQFAAHYSMSWSDFAAGHSGIDFEDLLGATGIDLDTNTVWAVLDHNSDFAITEAIPEPGTWALLVSGAAFMGWSFRRRRLAA